MPSLVRIRITETGIVVVAAVVAVVLDDEDAVDDDADADANDLRTNRLEFRIMAMIHNILVRSGALELTISTSKVAVHGCM
jgi:hypothetical protein